MQLNKGWQCLYRSAIFKKMKYLLLLFGISTLWASCAKSVFVPDQNNSLLPEYSESGRNIAGALINDTAWRCELHSCFSCIPWRFYINSNLSGDSTLFTFNGACTANSINFIDTSSYNIPVNLFIVVKGFTIENQGSLFKLNNKTFSLDGSNNYSGFSQYYDPITDKGSGSFTVTKVQQVKNFSYGDGTPNNPIIYTYIVSGRFNFEIPGSHPHTISDGRFDMEVSVNTNVSIQQ